MNLEQLRPIQKQLDDKILEQHGLTESNLSVQKASALICELWECMNESKVFKYWSVKKPNRDELLEEYVDSIHFALSLANDIGLSDYEYVDPGENDLNILAIGLTNMITRLPVEKNIEQVLNYLIKLGYQLGFTEEDVINEYYNKNKENHARQESGTY
ncbi:hypothetical protein GCM10007063_05740 [Lentibacillus kapialis]|uniref:dUTPase n=1 Tax=Lentibacillus kapialis TaxID=340214 RepID=A0A917PPK4_9BACI|nr:dUTP diphosphatase [Lentibacillus kapialis]GGJ86080.1 hypothetical protein GCM10007063_05740 [Lentibacillus kapialis]